MPTAAPPGAGAGAGSGPLRVPAGGQRVQAVSGGMSGPSRGPHGDSLSGAALVQGAPPQQLAEASELLSKGGKALASVRFSLDVLVENIGSAIQEASAAASALPSKDTSAVPSLARLGSGAAGRVASGSSTASPWRGLSEKARDGAVSAVRQFHGAVSTLSAAAKALEELGVLSSQAPSRGGTAAPAGTKASTSGAAVAAEAAGDAGAPRAGTQGPVTLFPGRVPLVCPDSVMQSYAWKRQIAGHAATGAALRARLALESFRSHRKRIFPEMHITPPELAPVPPKRPRLAEAGPEGTLSENHANAPVMIPADASGPAPRAESQGQGPGQDQGQPSVEASQQGVGSEGVGKGAKQDAEAAGGPALAPQTAGASGAAATEGGTAEAGSTGPGEGAPHSGSGAQPTGAALPPQPPAPAVPAPPAPFPGPALGSRTLGKPLLQGKGALGRPGLRGSNLLGSRLPPMKSATAMEADDLGPLEEELPLPVPGAAGAPGDATPTAATGDGAAGLGAEKPMAMDADDLGPLEGDALLPAAGAPAALADASGAAAPVGEGVEGKEKEGPGDGEAQGVQGSGEGAQAMDVDSTGAGPQGKAEGVPASGDGAGAKDGSAAGEAGTAGVTGDAAAAGPGPKAEAGGGGGEGTGGADPGQMAEDVPGGTPVAAATDQDGTAAPGVAAEAVDPVPPAEVVTVLPVEQHRDGSTLTRVLREVVRYSAGVQVAVCSRREWVQEVSSAWAQSMSVPQGGTGHIPGLSGLGLASAIGEAGSAEAWQKRTIFLPALSATAEEEDATGAAGRLGATAGTGSGGGTGAWTGAGTWKPSVGQGRGASVPVQGKMDAATGSGARQGEPGAGAQRPGMSAVESAGEAAQREGSTNGDGNGGESKEGGEKGDSGHLLAVVEVLLPGAARAVLSLTPAGSCCVTRLGLFAHNEIGPHVNPWGKSRHAFLRKAAQQMQRLVMCPSEDDLLKGMHLKRVLNEVFKLSDVFKIEGGYLGLR